MATSFSGGGSRREPPTKTALKSDVKLESSNFEN
jgi:hypothetical protein